MTCPRAPSKLWKSRVLYTQVRGEEEELAGRGGGSLTRRTQEDVHQVLIEDEGGRPLREQVEAD